MKTRTKVGAGVAGIAILAGCHYGPAEGEQVSATSYTANYSKQYQIDVGYPIIFITYQCHGDTTFHDTRHVNVNDYFPSDGDIKIAAYCADGFANAFPNDARS